MMYDLTCKKNFGVDAIITDIVVPAITINSDARFEKEVVWCTEINIAHNFDKNPSVTFIDNDGNVAIGSYKYIDPNNVMCYFDTPFTGKIYLN